jgi:hypothetical protein
VIDWRFAGFWSSSKPYQTWVEVIYKNQNRTKSAWIILVEAGQTVTLIGDI